MTNDIKLSIIIVNYNAPHLLSQCLISINRYINALPKEVIIVDNNSEIAPLKELEAQFDYVRVIKLDKNLGFGRANNIGVKNAKGDLILLLNSDTEFYDNSINKTINQF